MFENRSQQSRTEVKARIERSQNSSHEQTCFLLKQNLQNLKNPLRVVKNHDIHNNNRHRLAAIKNDKRV